MVGLKRLGYDIEVQVRPSSERRGRRCRTSAEAPACQRAPSACVESACTDEWRVMDPHSSIGDAARCVEKADFSSCSRRRPTAPHRWRHAASFSVHPKHDQQADRGRIEPLRERVFVPPHALAVDLVPGVNYPGRRDASRGNVTDRLVVVPGLSLQVSHRRTCDG